MNNPCTCNRETHELGIDPCVFSAYHAGVINYMGLPQYNDATLLDVIRNTYKSKEVDGETKYYSYNLERWITIEEMLKELRHKFKYNAIMGGQPEVDAMNREGL